MLLDNKIKITVTNDGKENKVSLSLNYEDKFMDVMTSIEMAQNTLRDAIGNYIKNKKVLSNKELDTILNSITLKEIYGS